MAHRRWTVVGVWLVLLAAVGATLVPLADSVVKTGSFTAPGTESDKVARVLAREFPNTAGTRLLVVFSSSTATVQRSNYRAAVLHAMRRLQAVPGVRSVVTYLNSGDSSLVSVDGHTTIGLVSVRGGERKQRDIVPALRAAIRGVRLTHYITGDAAVEYDTLTISEEDLQRFEIIAIPVILILLLLVFRTGVAAAMPLMLGACSVVLTTGLIAAIGSFLDVSVFSLNVASMLGLGLGIDFSLILVTRFRQELAYGGDRDAAIARTLATAGRSITYSAVLIMATMAVMTVFMWHLMDVRSISLGVMLVTLTTLLAGLTLTPAVLALLGRRIEWLPVIPLRKPSGTGEGAWYRLSRAIMARPWVWLALSFVLLLALASPVLHISVAVTTTGNLPPDTESVAGTRAIAGSFGPGYLSPIHVIVRASNGGAKASTVLSAARTLAHRVGRDQRVRHVQIVNPPGGSVVLLSIESKYGEFDSRQRDLVRDLRQRIIPGSPYLGNDEVLVGGAAANSLDVTDALYGRFPLVVVLVFLVIFCVLLMFFQSVTLPVKAMILNLATMLGTYGALVVLFQYGLAAWLLRFKSQGMLDVLTPVILFVILFGLSTDYEVFMLSRVKEFYEHSRSNVEAVAAGLQSTGGMITAAGLILIATFSVFATSQVITLKEIGLGLAIGVLLDATIVRVIMVPASMRLMGDWNWWMPRLLRGVVPELREAPHVAASISEPQRAFAPEPALPIGRAAGRPAVAPASDRMGASPAGPSVTGRFRLATDPPGNAMTLPWRKPLRIGRDSVNELQLADLYVSRFHARIDYADGSYFLSDVGGRNGVYLNGRRLPVHQRTVLRNGDRIQIGRALYALDLVKQRDLENGVE